MIKHPKKTVSVYLVYLISVIFLILGFNSYAQKKSIRFQHFTIDDGLPQNMVDCILQDSRGFMWFGTWNGLCSFDGYTFKDYKKQDSDHSTISDNFVYSICEDVNKNLWIGTNTGANLYLYDMDSFLNFNEKSGLESLQNTRINTISSTNDSLIWIGSSNGLDVFKIDQESNPTKINNYSFGSGTMELTGRSVNHIMHDSNKNLWISTNSGLCLLKKNADTLIKFQTNPNNINSLPHNSVRCTFQDSEGIIWIGTENGICKLDTFTSKFTNYFHNPLNQNTLPHNSIMSITEDIAGKIIIGTLGGISIYNKDGSNNFTNYYQTPNSEHDLNNDFINCVYADKWGNIWIGTERGGINKYNSSKTEFEYFEKEFGNPNSLSNNTINSILEDDKYIWIGTAGGGLNRYNKSKGTFKNYMNNPSEPKSLVNNFVTVLYRDTDKSLWVGTWGGGLHRLINENSSHEAFHIFRFGEENPNSLISDFVSSITQDQEGNLWIGTLGGLDRFNPKTGKFEHINEQISGKNVTEVGCLEIDDNGNLWFGTRTGLYKLDQHKTSSTEQKYTITLFNTEPSRSNSLSGDYVTSLFNDSYGNIWAGTYGYGLNKLVSEKNGGVFTRFTTNEGLSNNIIYTILEDLSGNLWLTTDNGLSRFNVKEKSFQNYYIADGLQNNQYYWSAAHINNIGKLYFGGMNGLNTFYPDWVNDVNSQASVVITNFRIYNESVVPGKEYDGVIAMEQSVITSDQITLSHKSREFSFEFSSLDYEQPNLNQYSYKLEGFDKEWIEVDANRRFANYTNLKPEDYVFKVRVKNNQGEYSSSTAKVRIKIIPPFWATIWFKIIVVGAIITIIVSYNRYRVYSLKVQKRKLEKQVKERTVEIESQKEKLEDKNIQLAQRQELIKGQNEKLEIQNEQILKQRDKLFELNKRVKMVNQLKLRFFTNISHEFRTPITLILGPLERLLEIEQETNSENYKSLLLINRNAQRLLQLINQLMDFRKLEQGKMKLHISKVDINSFLRNITSSFTILAEQRKIDLNFIPDPDLNEAYLDFQKIENVIYNLLSNSFKYTPEGGKIWIKYYKNKSDKIPDDILIVKDHLVIEIGDSGCGICTENLLNIFDRFYQIESEPKGNQPKGTGIGLSLAKELIEIHKGEIKVTSKENKGTTFYLHIPYKKEDFDDSSIKEISYDPQSIQKQANNLTNEFLAGENKKGLNGDQKLKNIKDRPLVLVVEDNNDLRGFIANKLNEKYNIIEASDGKEAYESAIINNPDVIVSDIMMPVMDGLEFCSRVKTNLVTSHIPVILLTAKGSIENQIEGLETGADKYLPKPFNFELLEVHISSLIESRKKLFEAFRIKNKVDSENITTTSTDEKFMNNVLQIVEENLDNPEFNVNTLLGELNISRSLLHRKITALTDQSTVEFINNIRLKKSVDMLKKTDLNISEIAYSVGFNDPKYFSRIFRKQFGKTPSEYQKNMSQKI